MNALAMLVLILVQSPDTLRLPALREAAVARDPRAEQLDLARRSHSLRLENLEAERLPRLAVGAEAAHQSEVVRIPIEIPGVEVPVPPRDRYQVAVTAQQSLYDGGSIAGRAAVERARLAEVEAELAATLYPLRMEVNEAFFTALLLQQREAETMLLIDELDARLAQVRAQFREGAALPGDTAALQVERLRAFQGLEETEAGRTAALAVLAELTGMAIRADAVLTAPATAEAMAAVERAGGASAVRARPEFARYAAAIERLEREAEAVSARPRPRVEGFGQAGLGRPGPFELFDDDINRFWQVGVRLEWRPWTWGSRDRDRQLLSIQQAVTRTEAEAFAARLERQVEADRRAIDQMENTLGMDVRIIALRDQLERQADAQHAERAITAAEYAAARTDLLEARAARDRHEIELERARTRYLTTLGLAPEEDD